MSHFIATHDAAGKATFSKHGNETLTSFNTPLGKMSMLYSTHIFPQPLDTEADLDQYLEDRVGGFGPGVPTPQNGTSAYLMEMKPGLEAPTRKIPALGVFYVIEGEILLGLDSGEERHFKAGDSGVIRSVAHGWKNVTPNGGWAKLVGFSQGIRA